MHKPNLFEFATSELSQDAFICWLLSYADTKYENSNNQLFFIATKLLKRFFEISNKPFPDKIDLKIYQQYKHIDIFIVINDKIAIIIEDKTHTKDHSDQLNKYREIVLSKNFSEDDLICIYFKTGDQCDYKEIIKKKYKIFLREDFLKILDSGIKLGVKNSIYVDYYDYLMKMEEDVNRYKNLEVKNWDSHNHSVGFFKSIKDTSDDARWDYVNNASGGFMGFWWNFEIPNTYENENKLKRYLQLEHRINNEKEINKIDFRLCFKIHVPDKEKRQKLRNKWSELVIKNAEKSNLNITKPARFGSGQWMTVANIIDYIVKKENGKIDIKKTKNLLLKVMDFNKDVISKNPF